MTLEQINLFKNADVAYLLHRANEQLLNVKCEKIPKQKADQIKTAIFALVMAHTRYLQEISHGPVAEVQKVKSGSGYSRSNNKGT